MSVSKSFTAVGLSDELTVPAGSTLSYSVSGTFVGTVVFEQLRLHDWVPVGTAIGPGSDSAFLADGYGKATARFRFRCSLYTSGTIVCAIAAVTSAVTSQRRSVTGTLVEEVTDAGLKQYSSQVISPKVTTAQGVVQAIEATFTETAGAGVYTGSVAVPAGATILDVIVNGVALWNPATSAAMDVGDVADPNGYYAGIDLMATDLLAGESVSFALAGGKAGAYIANSQVSPRYSATARVVSGIVTVVGGAGVTGRTRMTVVYQVPVTADIVAATKV